MDGPAVSVSGLVRRYGEVEAVRGIDLSIDPDETFGFLGPNGAGKSTTINILCTLIKPTAGSARVAGHDVVRERDEVRRNIGLVFQDTTLDAYLTAERNLRLHAELYGMPRNVIDGRLREVLDMVGLWDRRSSKVSNFSGGMKRRLEIARGLLHAPLILFLDELILWLASRATDLKFVHQEGQKLAKLVEAQTPDRPVPIISFVARQRDLSELIGEAVTGAQRLNFSDALKHWEGRFHTITLEDRNLPAIAEKRVLKCKSPAARVELDAAFAQTAKIRESVMNTLLTSEGDREMFRKLYPFSPALVQTLIAVSSVLQRERTALKVMMQLLVEQRDTLKVGDLLPVGDLFDVIAHGDEAFSQEMAIHFDNAKRLYHHKLLPLLEKQHGRREDVERLPYDDLKQTAFRNDDRLVKTLLLAALVPGVESLRALNAERLAALNHGTIKTPIPGREGQEVLRRCRSWAASVGEIRIGEEAANPTISMQLSGVDTETIIEQARREDNQGNRIRRVRQMLFEQLGIGGELEFEQSHDFLWRQTRRSCIVLFRNIRELPDTSLENADERWKLIIDYPFDEAGHGPRDRYQRGPRDGNRSRGTLPSVVPEGRPLRKAT